MSDPGAGPPPSPEPAARFGRLAGLPSRFVERFGRGGRAAGVDKGEKGSWRRWRPGRRTLWPMLGAVVLVAVLFVGVFPTRTYLAQRAAVARAEEQLRVITAENERLDDRIDALETPEEIERLAREQFELVMPGEQPYVVVPPSETPPPLPTGWPFGGLVVTGSPGT